MTACTSLKYTQLGPVISPDRVQNGLVVFALHFYVVIKEKLAEVCVLLCVLFLTIKLYSPVENQNDLELYFKNNK